MTMMDTITVDCGFPGGNVIVDAIDGNTITVHQDLRDTIGNWFYWYFRVRGASGRPLTVRITGSRAIGVRGPAVSLDAGRTWVWLGADAVDAVDPQTFRYKVPTDADEVRFSFCIPYLEANLREFLDHHRGDPHLEVSQLCTSEHGRSVELLRLGQITGSPRHRVLLTCRHHACEAMASYVLEGIIATILTDATAGQWLREHVEFHVVPFVDKDGVEQGDQGKNRAPHDHNRDYAEHDGIYAAIRAIRNLVHRLSNVLNLAFDLHCPAIRGEWNTHIYFVGTPNMDNWQSMGTFSDVLERERLGPLEYHASGNLPHGVAWNTGASYQDMLSCGRFLDVAAPDCTHAGLEFPYADVNGGEVNPESARAFGRDLARAIRSYLET